MKSEIIPLIFRLAALQGFILAFSLLIKKARTPANRTLGIWLIILSADLLFQSMVLDFRSIVEYPVLTGIFTGLPLIHGPMLFLYTRFATGGQKQGPKKFYHFIPFAVYKFYLIPYFLLSHDAKLNFLNNLAQGMPLGMKLMNLGVGIQGFVYTLLAFSIIRKHAKKVLEYFSYRERVLLKWLRVMIVINVFIWVLVLAGSSFAFFIDRPISGNMAIYSLAALWVYVVGYFGFSHGVIFPGKLEEVERVGNLENTERSLKYEKNKLSPEKKDKIADELELCMETKIWLEPEITIKDISNAINIPIHQISQVINDKFTCNFFTYINSFRIREAMARLRDPDDADRTILQIALNCGFNSKSSFNSLFKENTGMTPGEFRKQNQ